MVVRTWKCLAPCGTLKVVSAMLLESEFVLRRFVNQGSECRLLRAVWLDLTEGVPLEN